MRREDLKNLSSQDEVATVPEDRDLSAGSPAPSFGAQALSAVHLKAPPNVLEWFRSLADENRTDSLLLARMPENEIDNIVSTLSGGTLSLAGAFADLRTCGINASIPHANRSAPKGLDAIVQKGDCVYFSGNHAEMCVGKTADGKAIWCSDTNQGTNFFVNDQCQNGTFVVYRPDASFDVNRAVTNLSAHAEAGYTGNCAKYVREYGIDGGLQGSELTSQPSSAAGYVANGASLKNSGFRQIIAGGPSGFSASQDAVASASVPPSTKPSVARMAI